MYIKPLPHDGLSLVPYISDGCASLHLRAQLCQKHAAEAKAGSQLHASCSNKSVPRLLCCAFSDRTGDRSPEVTCWQGNHAAQWFTLPLDALMPSEFYIYAHMSCLHLTVRT